MDPTAAPAPVATPDPISKSSLVRGIVALCICGFPIGSIVAIFLGISAMKRAKLGREAIEASGGTLSGKGAHIAGKICGITAIALGAFLTVYYLVAIGGVIFFAASRGSGHY